MISSSSLFFFFFQAEDGIRDRDVTGVQTCALPISPKPEHLISQSPLVRGYDSGELFREDLWIRRIEESRRQIATLGTSAPRLEADIEAREDYGNRVCAMLAHHGVTRCDN